MKLVILLTLAALAAADGAHSVQPFTHGLASSLEKWAALFPGIRNRIESKNADLPNELQHVINKGFLHYLDQTATTLAIESVHAGMFNFFVAYIVKTLAIPEDRRAEFISGLTVIKNADNSDWTMMDIMYSPKRGSSCNYISVLGRRDLDLRTYSFLITDLWISFDLAPDVLLIEERKSSLWGLDQTGDILVERIPATLKLQDVQLLKSFFRQIALTRVARSLRINVPGLEQAFLDPISIIGIISAGLEIIPKIWSIFKTTITSEIIKEVIGDGFSHYEQSSKYQGMEGIQKKIVETVLMPSMPKLLDLSPGAYEGVVAAVTIGMYAEKYTWNDFKVAFNNEKSVSNKVQFVDVVCNNRGDDMFNMILVSVVQTFQLAPNVQYIKNDKSYVGGIYSSSKIERRVYPRSITEKDLEVLMGFFHITVFKRLANAYKVPFPELPDRPPLKP